MNSYTRSDLACESVAIGSGQAEGVECKNEQIGGISVQRMQIITEAAAKELGKPCGRYVTVDCGKPVTVSDAKKEMIAHLLAGEIRGMATRLTQKAPDSDFSVFVAGLGNAELTADAIGPKTVGRLTATRHLREHEARLYRELGCCALSAIAPGVLGQTGIETLALLQGAIEHVGPDLVVVIDALAARSCERLASTVQITDVGIHPGSGVGNHRAAIDQKSLGVPVIVLGVPTVVNSATLVFDALREAGIEEPSAALKKVLESGKSFFVSPKESDVITDRISDLIADAVDTAFTLS